MNKSPEKAIGINIRKIREEYGMTQDISAARCSLRMRYTCSAVAKIEEGQRHLYSDKTL